MNGTVEKDILAVGRDWRAGILWGALKVVFSALVLVGVQGIYRELGAISATITAQKLDHQKLGTVGDDEAVDRQRIISLERQTDQVVDTLKAYGQAIQTLQAQSASDEHHR